MLACSRAWCAYLLTCSPAHVLGMATCLACLHVIVFGVFTVLACLPVLCPYVLTFFTCWLCSNILHAYVLADFFDMVCPISFVFEKLTSKNPYIEKFIFIQRSI